MLISHTFSEDFLENIFNDLNFKEAFSNAKSVLFIISSNFSKKSRKVLEDEIEILSKGKIFRIIDELELDKADYDNYKYFGSSFIRAPILLHNIICEYDLTVPISPTYFTLTSGIYSSATLFLSSLSSAKTMAALYKNMVEDNIEDLSKLIDTSIQNLIQQLERDVFITSSKETTVFAMNLLSASLSKDGNEMLFSGDLLLSKEEARKHLKPILETVIIEKSKVDNGKYNGLRILIEDEELNSNRLFSIIAFACNESLKGARVELDFSFAKLAQNDMLFNDDFKEIFYNNTISDIFSNFMLDNSPLLLYAILIKYFSLNYHIAFFDTESDINDELNITLVQIGLNILEDNSSFLA